VGNTQTDDGGIMMQTAAIWSILQTHAPRKRWISIGELYTIVESHSTLDNEDLEVHASHTPMWKLNVRRVLENKKRTGRVQGRKRE